VTTQVNRECTRIDANLTAGPGNAFARVPPHSRLLAFIRGSTPEQLPKEKEGNGVKHRLLTILSEVAGEARQLDALIRLPPEPSDPLRRCCLGRSDGLARGRAR
jgi:hypothetical protein